MKSTSCLSSFLFFSRLKTEIVNGLWDGPLIGFQKWFLTLNMTLIANYQNGVLQGKVWKPLEENGYLISDNLQMHGKDVLYIYPGFQLGFHGEFNYGKMVTARPIRIKGYSCDQNVMVPHWEYLPENSQIYSYDQASLERLSKYPTLKDPLEEFYLEVLPSTISGAGDGVFLKRNAPKNTVVGFFNGINITLEDTFKDQDMKSSVHKMWNDWETDELLYIPKEFININAYNATFGHKINHNSDYNVDAGYITHPRYSVLDINMPFAIFKSLFFFLQVWKNSKHSNHKRSSSWSRTLLQICRYCG